MSPRRRRTLLTTGLLAVLLLAGAAVSAQRFGGFGSFREGTFPTLWAPPTMPEADFTFCRLAYRSVRFEQSGIGWQTDYPYAEINLMTRLSELTKTHIGRDDTHTPRHYVVRLTDDTLFNCPFLMASDPGTMGLSDTEAERLRKLLRRRVLEGAVRAPQDWHADAIRNALAGGERPAADANEPPVQMERLLDFTNNNPDDLRELIALYLKQTGEQVEQLAIAVRSNATTEEKVMVPPEYQGRRNLRAVSWRTIRQPIPVG